MSDDRIVGSSKNEMDDNERHLRPQVLDDFIGQKQVRENLSIFIQAAKARGEALDHGRCGPRCWAQAAEAGDRGVASDHG